MTVMMTVSVAVTGRSQSHDTFEGDNEEDLGGKRRTTAVVEWILLPLRTWRLVFRPGILSYMEG